MNLVLRLTFAATLAGAAQEKTWSEREIETMHAAVRIRPGEARWFEVPWQTSLTEARKKAAAEGKPILVASMGAGDFLGTS